MLDDVLDLDATAQAALIAAGEVSALELTRAAIQRIEAQNPALNAVVVKRYAEAEEAARGPLSGPFAGVPFLLKDLPPAMWAGAPLSSGSRALAGFVAPLDSTLVERFKAAGLVLLGKTNTPELGLLPTTEPQLFGPTRNPWDLARTPGGSSGGAAAAVAAGMVPMAHASDGGGSIRIPAACTGLFGLKPSRGRTTQGPLIGDIMGGLVNEHVLSRSVRDSARLLDATAGGAPGDPYLAPPPAEAYARAVERPPPRLKIALSLRPPSGVPVDPECARAVEETGRLLQSLGHTVEEARPSLDAAELLSAFMAVWTAGTAHGVLQIEGLLGRRPAREELEPFTWALAEMAATQSAAQYLEAQASLQRCSRALAAFLAEWELWLTPTTASPPLPLGSFAATADDPLAPLLRASEWVPFTPLANLAGLPAMSVPLGASPDGLPIGVHFLGRAHAEHTLFALAAELERAAPWVQRRPKTRDQ